MSNKK